MRTLRSQLFLTDLVGAVFSALRRWKVDSRRSLGSAPSSLADEEARADGSRIYLAGLFVHNGLLSFDHCARLAFVIDPKDLRPQLEFPAFRCRRKWFQELDQALSVDNALCIQLGHTGDWVARLSGVEVNDFLGSLLERFWVLT